jgi:ribosomal protein S18 acetylase RimI-like enzyme
MLNKPEMKTEFSIRDYTDADFPDVAALWTLLGLGNAARGDDAAVIRRTLSLGGRLLLLHDPESGKLVGTSWLTVDGRRTYLHHFGIHTDVQGRGLARALLDESLRVAVSLGMQIKLEVHQQHARAIELYTRAGFTDLGDYRVYIIRDISGIRFA